MSNMDTMDNGAEVKKVAAEAPKNLDDLQAERARIDAEISGMEANATAAGEELEKIEGQEAQGELTEDQKNYFGQIKSLAKGVMDKFRALNSELMAVEKQIDDYESGVGEKVPDTVNEVAESNAAKITAQQDPGYEARQTERDAVSQEAYLNDLALQRAEGQKQIDAARLQGENKKIAIENLEKNEAAAYAAALEEMNSSTEIPDNYKDIFKQVLSIQEKSVFTDTEFSEKDPLTALYNEADPNILEKKHSIDNAGLKWSAFKAISNALESVGSNDRGTEPKLSKYDEMYTVILRNGKQIQTSTREVIENKIKQNYRDPSKQGKGVLENYKTAVADILKEENEAEWSRKEEKSNLIDNLNKNPEFTKIKTAYMNIVDNLNKKIKSARDATK